MALRVHYQGQLAELEDEIIAMAELVENTYEKARAQSESGVAEETWSLDTRSSDIGADERKVETLALRVLLLQQPVAGDLREVTGALKMVTDLKRIGDLAIDICRVVDDLNGRIFEIQKTGMADMAALVDEMVRVAIDSYTDRNMRKSDRAVRMEDEVDTYLRHLREEIIGKIFDKAIDAQDAVDLLMIAKCYERIGDHAESIAYWTEYVVKGTRKGEPFTAAR